MEDEKIVELYLARDEDAITQTKVKYGFKLRKIANNILNNPESAEECENDAYFETWRLIPPHEPRGYLFAFIGRIVRHRALNICKKNNTQKRNTEYCELTLEMQECIPSADNTEAEIETKYLKIIIDNYLESCSVDQRKVFVRRYWYFDSVSDIAKMYGFTQSKVKTMLFRMRSELKECLEERGYQL